MIEQEQPYNKVKLWMNAVLPLILLGILLGVFLKFGPIGVFKAALPPIEKAFIQQVIFAPEQITVEVFNDGPESITIAQVLVKNVYWQFTMTPSTTLQPLEKGIVELSYPWIAGEPITITLLSSTGITFEKNIEVMTLTPRFNMLYIKVFILLGLYVGVIPVFLGLLWFPFLKMLRARWYSFLLALTIGLLIFLGFDAIDEAFELTKQLPQAFNGIGILVIGFFIAVLTLSAVSYKTQHLKIKAEHYQTLVWAYLISLGIGLHNLGEGLAIGSAYVLGEIALGSLLVIGFMVHNVTEGVAIVAPLTRTSGDIKNFFFHLLMMGLIAGGPTIIGALIGGFAYSPLWGVFFLAIGAGAIFDVAFDILNHMAKGQWLSLFTVTNVLGFLSGLLIMYVTGFLVLMG